MKVYVVSPDYDVEGYGEPEAAFSTMEKAIAYAAEFKKKRHTARSVFDLEVDEEETK